MSRGRPWTFARCAAQDADNSDRAALCLGHPPESISTHSEATTWFVSLSSIAASSELLSPLLLSAAPPGAGTRPQRTMAMLPTIAETMLALSMTAANIGRPSTSACGVPAWRQTGTPSIATTAMSSAIQAGGTLPAGTIARMPASVRQSLGRCLATSFTAFVSCISLSELSKNHASSVTARLTKAPNVASGMCGMWTPKKKNAMVVARPKPTPDMTANAGTLVKSPSRYAGTTW
mmetsp:Transcript_19006/g.48755  ORF Transcript_19006/g.48755 Transcript_19006/m.48755 type:complete len:234 (+) Transcript_19006:66-767(+)